MALLAAGVVLSLAGCEKSQADAARLKKAGAKASQGAEKADKAYTASGWTAGDDASWQAQIRARTEGQNEYARIPASTLGGSPVPAAPTAVPTATPAAASTGG
jgi:hypothetical protein